jgi:hypothetical protein
VLRYDDIEKLVRLVLALTALLQVLVKLAGRKRAQRVGRHYRRRTDAPRDSKLPGE